MVANFNDADPGFVGERFRHHGFAFTECHRERWSEWPDLAGIDLVLVLGSEWSVYWEHLEAEVAAESALIRAAHGARIPIFGICYGSQIVAHALGGQVSRAARPEVGWQAISSTKPQVIAPGPWMQWHFDLFSPAPGFEVLATSESGPQVVSGGRTFATQFHPEATETIVARWTGGGGGDDLERMGLTPERLMADTREHVKSSRRAAATLVDWFLTDIATR